MPKCTHGAGPPWAWGGPMTRVESRPFLPAPARQPRLSRRAGWMLCLAAGALVIAALGFLLADQVQARAGEGEARSSLGVTQRQTRTVSAQLHGLRRDLSVLKTQVGND